jgi:hypothetical protein
MPIPGAKTEEKKHSLLKAFIAAALITGGLGLSAAYNARRHPPAPAPVPAAAQQAQQARPLPAPAAKPAPRS